jgi:3-phosphoglycerate kinase
VKREKRDWVEVAKEIFARAESLGKKIICPRDLVISDGTSIKIITTEDVPAGWMALDIGPLAQKDFSEVISQSKTVFINGPMGKFGVEGFGQGTESILGAMKNLKKNLDGETIIAGGDTIDAAGELGSLDEYSNVSLAGGATLEFLAGKELPALVPLTQ